MAEKLDNISLELREIEKEVDNYYKSNPLLNLPFAEAAWYLLAYYDDLNLIELTKIVQGFFCKSGQVFPRELSCD